MPKEIETIEELVVFRNEFVTVYNDRVRFPGGREGTYFKYSWNAPYGVAVVPVHDGCVALVRQYRYAMAQFVTEVVQGFGTFQSSPEHDALRELSEETGLKSRKLIQLGTMHSNQPVHVFAAAVDDLDALTEMNQEASESICGFEILRIANMDIFHLQRVGVQDPLSLAILLGYKDVLSKHHHLFGE